MAETLDYAIVGGGVSGVYCAWRLQQKHPDAKIVVFEGSDHIGGRLLSVPPPGIDNMIAELGGMRILPRVQPLIAGLIEVLNKETPDDPIELYDFPVDEPQNIAYLRGVHLRLADFTEHPDKVPYHLNFIEHGQSSGAIILGAIEQIVPGITDPGLTEHQRRLMVRNAEFEGRPLYKQGFWNVLLRVISNEAYELGVDAGGYNTTVSNWNAADAIPWFLSDFGIDPDYKGFKKGFQQVPLKLAELFKREGGEIRLKTRLEGFDRKGKGFQLTLDQGKAVTTKHLILAMPRRSLDLLAPTSPPLQEEKVQRLTSSVTPRPLFKLFTTYKDPWWRNAGYTAPDGQSFPVESGRTVTDLPVRQTYYWPTDQGQPATDGPSMLMASYDDGDNIGFWDGFRPQRRQAWQKGDEVPQPANPFEGALEVRDDCDWAKYKAPAPMVGEVSRQLQAIHGLEYTPPVQTAAFRDWGDDPFGGGWNSWNIGVESWEVKQEITQPIEDCPLYICGEAYSDAQGWVEGALDTADIVLDRLGLDPLV